MGFKTEWDEDSKEHFIYCHSIFVGTVGMIDGGIHFISDNECLSIADMKKILNFMEKVNNDDGIGESVTA